MPNDNQTADFQQNVTTTEKSELPPATEAENNTIQNDEPEVQQLSQKQLNEIAKLHRECAKYRTALNSSNTEKADLEKLFQNLKADFDSVSRQKYNQEILHKLEMAGCLKPDLVLKDIPVDCENLDGFLADYKKNNNFLFKKEKVRHGFTFRGGKSTNYTPSQQMNNYIRSALGR